MGTLIKVSIEEMLRVLKITGGNKTRAARILGISIRTLRTYVKKYDLLKPYYVKPHESYEYIWND